MVSHFAFYERIPPAGGLRGLFVKLMRRMIRRVMWPIFLSREVRFQRIYDTMQALRAEQRRVDGEACMRLAIHRRLDFIEKAMGGLQGPLAVDQGLRAINSGPPRARCA